MTVKTFGSNGFSQYILTLTLYEHLSSFKRVGLKIPSREFVEKIEDGVTQRIKKSFEGSRSVVEVIHFTDFCDEIVSAARVIKAQMPDAVVITTTPMISSDSNGICIGLSRLIDINGELISIGSRAGFPSISTQIKNISADVSGKRVIILDDGSFTGSTLCFMIDQLSKQRAEVSAVIVGILFPEARERLQETFKGELVHRYHFEKPYDWMPSHDFFPFIPNSGRVIGTKIGDTLIPFRHSDRSTMSKPYILPYGKLEKWAGLQMSQDELIWLSQFCITGSTEIFQEMEKINGRTIKVGDLILTDTSPVTSVPVAFGRERVDFYTLGDRVVDLLNSDYALLVT